MSDAIPCPECMTTGTRVVDSRPSYERGSIHRRRECCLCGCRWSTYEVEADRLELLEDQLRTRTKKGGGPKIDPPPR